MRKNKRNSSRKKKVEPECKWEYAMALLPTLEPPGSDGKIQIMKWRLKYGLSLYHPRDFPNHREVEED